MGHNWWYLWVSQLKNPCMPIVNERVFQSYWESFSNQIKVNTTINEPGCQHVTERFESIKVLLNKPPIGREKLSDLRKSRGIAKTGLNGFSDSEQRAKFVPCSSKYFHSFVAVLPASTISSTVRIFFHLTSIWLSIVLILTSPDAVSVGPFFTDELHSTPQLCLSGPNYALHFFNQVREKLKAALKDAHQKKHFWCPWIHTIPRYLDDVHVYRHWFGVWSFTFRSPGDTFYICAVILLYWALPTMLSCGMFITEGMSNLREIIVGQDRGPLSCFT